MSAELHGRVQRMLDALGCDIGASECHGILCGMLSGPGRFDPELWIVHFSGQDDITPYSGDADHAALLSTLHDLTLAELDGEDFDFELLLPPESAALEERVGAFAAWCRGYLSGLGLSGLPGVEVLGEDARGFLQDLQRFGGIDVRELGDEDDERALSDLSEFTRMGVMIVRAEAHNGAATDAAPTVH